MQSFPMPVKHVHQLTGGRLGLTAGQLLHIYSRHKRVEIKPHADSNSSFKLQAALELGVGCIYGFNSCVPVKVKMEVTPIHISVRGVPAFIISMMGGLICSNWGNLNANTNSVVIHSGEGIGAHDLGGFKWKCTEILQHWNGRLVQQSLRKPGLHKIVSYYLSRQTWSDIMPSFEAHLAQSGPETRAQTPIINMEHQCHARPQPTTCFAHWNLPCTLTRMYVKVTYFHVLQNHIHFCVINWNHLLNCFL